MKKVWCLYFRNHFLSMDYEEFVSERTSDGDRKLDLLMPIKLKQ
jgi:hypothetical protein